MHVPALSESVLVPAHLGDDALPPPEIQPQPVPVAATEVSAVYSLSLAATSLSRMSVAPAVAG